MSSPTPTTTDVPGSDSSTSGKRRENAHVKARRLLTEGRLTVLRVNREADVYEAEVRGDSAAVYRVRWNGDRVRWTCTCPALGECSHVLALQLVVVRT